MWKFNSTGVKWLKVTHILLVVLFLGGILSSFAMMLNLDLADYLQVQMTYRSMHVISNNIVKLGAQGTILLGLVYGFFTQWGFVKHKWLTFKWSLFILQTFLGILVVDKLLVSNLALLEAMGTAVLNDPVFVSNHYLRQYVVVAQVVFTLITLAVSVIKPWRSKTKFLGLQPA